LGIAAVDHDSLDPLGMACRVCDRDRRALRHPEERKAVKRRRIHDGLEIPHPSVHRQITDLPVGQPAAGLVIADERVGPAELFEPVPPDRVLPVVLKMREPVRGLDDRRPTTVGRVGEAQAVRRGAEADPLLH